MGCALQSAGIGHPWPDVIPSSRFGQRPAQPVYHEQVDPSVVVEVTADAAFELFLEPGDGVPVLAEIERGYRPEVDE